MRTLSLIVALMFGFLYHVDCKKSVDCSNVFCFAPPDCSLKANKHDCCNYCGNDNGKVCPAPQPYNEPQCDPFATETGCKDNEGCCKDGCGYVCKKKEKNGNCKNTNNYNCINDDECKSNEKCCLNGCGRSCMKAVRDKGKRCEKSSDGDSYIEVNENVCQLCYCNNGNVECSDTECPCMDGDKQYRHLQEIPSEDPCEHCYCDNGKKQCAVQSCLEPDCENPSVPEGECCATCPEE